ncbi:membrane protein [Marinobacterium nitratireducens]|uniref:Membrane protein n=1 Tax=Marinobacterium nitratireducens TaxID=518897 RepID=A0A917ZRT3_9GAMM|nr:DMT family transporter [Marinobacterium nitratireducens]GGO89422.1 membrane protein [Marinobacterium nitratireducens]
MTLFLYASTVMIWGTTWIAIMLQLGDVPVTVSIFYRFALAALILVGGLWLSGRLRRLSGRDHLFCMLQGGCIFSFNFYCFYSAGTEVTSGLESVIFSMATLFNAVNAMLFFGQRIDSRFWLATLLGFAGMLSLFWRDLAGDGLNLAMLGGIGLCLLGTYLFSLGNMISLRHQRRGLDLLSTNAWAMGYGALWMLIVSLSGGAAFAPEWTVSYLGALLYLAIFGSVLGFAAYFTLIGRIGAGPAAYATLLFPLVALSISTLVEGYRWTPGAMAGMALILTGNLVMFSPRGLAGWPARLRWRREPAR